MAVPRSTPYIWVTWLSRMLVGDSTCEWATWFRSHYTQFDRAPSTFDAATWQMEHTALLKEVRLELEEKGDTVLVENQNHFTLRGASGVALGGKPDLVSLAGETATIYDIKTGQPRASDYVQVMIYMYALPHAFRQYKGMTFNGMVVYHNDRVPIPTTAINEPFKTNLVNLIHRVSGPNPLGKTPSAIECSMCEIARSSCPERVQSGPEQEAPTVPDF